MFLVQLSSDGVQLTQELSVFRAGPLGGCALWAAKQKINQIFSCLESTILEHNTDPLILIQVDTELLKFITLCLEANHI